MTTLTTANTKPPKNPGISSSSIETTASNSLSKNYHQSHAVQRNSVNGQVLLSGNDRNHQEVTQTSLMKAAVTFASSAKCTESKNNVKPQQLWWPPKMTIPSHVKYISQSDDPIQIDCDDDEDDNKVNGTLQQKKVDVILIEEEIDIKDEGKKKRKNLETNSVTNIQNKDTVNKLLEQKENDVILIDEETDNIDTKKENNKILDATTNMQNSAGSQTKQSNSERLNFETDARPRYTYIIQKNVDLDLVFPEPASSVSHTVSNVPQVASNTPQNMSKIKQLGTHSEKRTKHFQYAAEDAPFLPSTGNDKECHVNTFLAATDTSSSENTISESVLDSNSDGTSEIILLEAFSLQPDLERSICSTQHSGQVTMKKHSSSQNSFLALSKKAFFSCGQNACTFSTVMPVEFEVHQLRFHADSSHFYCVHCGHVASKPSFLIQHLHSHIVNEMGSFSGACCYSHCSYMPVTYNDLLIHIAQNHYRQTCNICFLCKQEFTTCLGLVNHLQQNTISVMKCPHCSAKDVTKDSILRHIAQNHPECNKFVNVFPSILCQQRNEHAWPIIFKEKTSDAVSTSHCSSMCSLSMEKQQQLKEELQCGGLNMAESDSLWVMNPPKIIELSESAEVNMVGLLAASSELESKQCRVPNSKSASSEMKHSHVDNCKISSSEIESKQYHVDNCKISSSEIESKQYHVDNRKISSSEIESKQYHVDNRKISSSEIESKQRCVDNSKSASSKKESKQCHIDNSKSAMSKKESKQCHIDNSKSAMSEKRSKLCHIDNSKSAMSKKESKQCYIDNSKSAMSEKRSKQCHVDNSKSASSKKESKQCHVDNSKPAMSEKRSKQCHVDNSKSASSKKESKQCHVDNSKPAMSEKRSKQCHVDNSKSVSSEKESKQCHVDNSKSVSSEKESKQCHVDNSKSVSSEKESKQCHVDDSKSSKEHMSKTFFSVQQSKPDSELVVKGRKKRILKCKECNLVSSHCGSMYKHIRRQHDIIDMVICEICKISLSTHKIMDHHIQYHNSGDEDYIPTTLSDAFEIFWEESVEKDTVNKKRFKKSSFRKKPVLERNIVEKITENANEYIDDNEWINCEDSVNEEFLCDEKSPDSDKGPTLNDNKTDVEEEKIIQESRKRKSELQEKRFMSVAKPSNLQEKQNVCSKENAASSKEDESIDIKKKRENQEHDMHIEYQNSIEVTIEVKKKQSKMKNDMLHELESCKEIPVDFKEKRKNFNSAKRNSDKTFNSVASKNKKFKLQKTSVCSKETTTILKNYELVNKKSDVEGCVFVEHENSKEISVEIKEKTTKSNTKDDIHIEYENSIKEIAGDIEREMNDDILSEHESAIAVPVKVMEKNKKSEKEHNSFTEPENTVTLPEIKQAKCIKENKVSASVTDNEKYLPYRKLRKHTRLENIKSCINDVPFGLEGNQMFKQKVNAGEKKIGTAVKNTDTQKETSVYLKEANSGKSTAHMEYKSMQKETSDHRKIEINTNEKLIACTENTGSLEEHLHNEGKVSSAEDKSVQQKSHSLLGNKQLVVRLKKTDIKIPFPLECINKMEAAVKKSSTPQANAEIRKCVGIKEEDCPDELQFLHPDFEFRCKYCTHRGGSFERFSHHLYYHFHYRKYACSYCSFEGFSQSRIITHVVAEHPTKINKPNVIIRYDTKKEKRVLDMCHFCFVPKLKDDVDLRERLAKKKLRLAGKLQNKKTLKKRVSAKKVLQKNRVGKKVSILKKLAKLSKHLSNSKKRSAGETSGYMCPYCRENRPLMSWLALHIEICYHIHYKPLYCGYCSELQTASMLRLKKHCYKNHPGKKMKCIQQLNKGKEEKLISLANRSVQLSKQYNRAKSGQPEKSSTDENSKRVGWKVLRYTKVDFKPAIGKCSTVCEKKDKRSKTSVKEESLETNISGSSFSPNTASSGGHPLNEYRIYKSHELFIIEKDCYDDPVYQCIKCDYTIRNLKSMYTHSYRHQPQIFLCGYCDFRGYPRYVEVINFIISFIS